MKNHRQYLSGLTALLLVLAMAAPPALAQSIHPDSLDRRDGLYYAPGSDVPYTGAVEDPGLMRGQLEDGHRVGTWKWWHDNGTPASVTEYEAGRPLNHVMWYANGAKRMEGAYVEGRPDGIHTRWNESGLKASEAIYRAGSLHGVRRLWDPDGHLLHEAHYEDDQLHGPSIWYYADGEKRWETHYEAGQRTGTWRQWTSQGELFMESQWEDGQLVHRHNPHEGH